MDRQTLIFAVSTAGLFGAVFFTMGYLADRNPGYWPQTKDLVGCWSNEGWRVEIAPGSLTAQGTTLKATEVQRIKNVSWVYVEPFNIAGNTVGKNKGGKRGMLLIASAGPKVEAVQLVDAESNSTPALGRC